MQINEMDFTGLMVMQEGIASLVRDYIALAVVTRDVMELAEICF